MEPAGPDHGQQPEPPASSEDRSAGEAGKPARGEAWGARKALEVLAIAFVFPLAIYVGFLAGRWVGERFAAPLAGGLLGAVIGAAAGFWELFRFLRRSGP